MAQLIKDYELSLWKETIESYAGTDTSAEVDGETKYYNIYKGLDTPSEDLSFWYLPRKWDNVTFDNTNTSGVVHVNMLPPQKRKESEVHADFSTSNLLFKPNTYYTFLLELNFPSDSKKPNWEAYLKNKPNAINHCLVSLVTGGNTDNEWSMPDSIFNSNLILSYSSYGFSTGGTVLNNEHEAVALFVDNNTMDKGIAKAQVIKFIGCVKTKNFIKDNITLGIWSFLEGWADDYWTADMKISVFEDNIIGRKPDCYSKLFKTYSGKEYTPEQEQPEGTVRGLLYNELERVLPADDVISQESNAFFVKQRIDNIIDSYYRNMYNETKNYILSQAENGKSKAEICTAILDTQNPYLPVKLQTLDKSSFITNDTISSNALANSKEVANILFNTFTGVCFPYLTIKENYEEVNHSDIDDISTCYELKNGTYIKTTDKTIDDTKTYYSVSADKDIYYSYQDDSYITSNNLIKVFYEGMVPIIQNDFLDFPLMDENILKVLKVNADENPLFIGFENYNFFGKDELLADINLDTIISEKQEEYWEKFIDTSQGKPYNQLYSYINTVYTDAVGEEGFFRNSDELQNKLQVLYRYGFMFLLSPYIKQTVEKIRTTFNFNTAPQYSIFLMCLIGSYGLNLEVDYINGACQYDWNRVTLHFKPELIYNNGIDIISTITESTNMGFPIRKHADFKAIATTFKNFNNNNSDYIKTLILSLTTQSAKAISDLSGNYNNSMAFVKSTNRLEEKKVCIFGAPNGPDWYAQEISLNRTTKNDLNTLTFSLYDNYYNPITGKKEKNPIIDQLVNESKVKLFYENKWFDFIIKEQNLDSTAHKTTYIAKDAFVIELSKIGFNKTFNSELDNNIGTIETLGEAILEGTGWKMNQTEKFYQSAQKAIFGGFLANNIKIVIPASNGNDSHYYYNSDLQRVKTSTSSINIVQNNKDNTDYNTFIYLLYDESLEETTTPKLIIASWENTSEEQSIAKNSYQTIDNVLVNVYICPDYILYKGDELYKPELKEYNVLSSNSLVLNTIDIFKDGQPLYFDYTLRAKDIVTKPIMHYSVPLKRYVTEYEKTENNKTTTVYGYAEGAYTTKPLVQNLLPNGEDFTSLTGWVNGSTNDYFTIRMNLDAATKNNDISTITSFLNFTTSVESGNNRLPHGFICNTDLSYNFAAVDHLTPGDEFVLRVQVERGNDLKSITTPTTLNDDQLILMETMRPYLYCYEGSAKLQSKNNTTILPKANQQVMTFLQDKRFIDKSKYNSGILSEKTTGSDGDSSYSRYVYDLANTMNKQGLVSLHWSNSPKVKNSNELNKDVTNINNIPCAYIKKELAEQWEILGHIQHFDKAKVRQNAVGGSKNFYFTSQGWAEFIKLFKGTSDSDFNLRDFAIIADISNHITDNSIDNPYPGNTKQMYYYLPMLFSDVDLMEEIKKQKNTQSNSIIIDNITYNKDTLCKNFFKYSNWQEVLKTREYYDVNSTGRTNGYLRAYPKNVDIEFDGKNTIGDSIAYLDINDYPDFDLLMRMRMYWRVVRYSEANTCIFETNGIFYGKPILDTDNRYRYTTSTQASPAGYTYQDLLSNHLGLFFTFDQTMYDNGGKGNSKLNISKVELFRKFVDGDGEIVLPNKIIETNDSPIYRFYKIEDNLNAIKEADIKYDYVGTTIPDNYKVKIDTSGERRNALTITESNCYNMLQKLAETFDGWLEINVKHNSDGSLDLTADDMKTISFVNVKYNDNYSGIKYGINLQKIQRKIDSNDIITKLIVKNNNNEYGQNGFCSIARSKLNLNSTNAILNFNHFINMGLLPTKVTDILYNDIYPRTYAFGQFLSQIIDERAKQSVIVSQLKANTEYYQLVVSNAKDKLSERLDQYDALHLTYHNNGRVYDRPIGYYINDESARNKLTTTTKSIVDSIMFYNGMISGFTTKLSDVLTEYNKAVQKYNLLIDMTTSVTAQRDSLLNEFYTLCQGYIREGAWSSEDYLDDDLYYLDAERQASEYAVPRVTYNIDVVDLSSLPGYEAYSFDLRDKTYIEDVEVFGIDRYTHTPIKEEIIVTEKTDYLNSPEKNVITVQNYKTHFGDLFQRIMSTIQAVEFGTLNYTNKNSDNNLDTRLSNNEITLQALKQFNKI